MCDLSLFSCVFDKPLVTGSLDYPVEPLSQKTVLPGAFTSECKPEPVPGYTEGGGAFPAAPVYFQGVFELSRCTSRPDHLLQTDGNHLLPRKDVYHGLGFSLAHRFPLHETTWVR